MMQGRIGVVAAGAALALLALFAVASTAAAQAPGTMVLDLTIDAGVTELRPGPLTVPNPEVPNPFYDTLLAAEPVMELSPMRLEDAPDGLYLQSENLPPMRVIKWTTGVDQRAWAPLEYLGQALGAQTPFVQVNGCACVPSQPGLSGIVTIDTGLPAPLGIAADGVRPENLGPLDEVATLPLLEESRVAVPEPYQSSRAPGEPAALGPETALALPAKNDSTTALAAVLAAGAALLLLKFIVLPLYHRFKRKTALDNPTRQGLYEQLRAAPGASAAELSQASGLHVTTVKYHLDVLRRVGMVGEQVVDGCRRFFSYENGDRVEFLTRALLDEPAAKAIYAQIEQHPGLPFIEVARALGMRKEHVHYHVKKLAKHGLLVDRWEAGRRLLFVAPAAHPQHIAGHVPPVPAAPLPAPVSAVAAAPAPAPMPLHPEVRA